MAAPSISASAPAGTARYALMLLRNLLLANLAFNGLATALGLPYPFTSFLFESSDLFGDFFKFALSFPGGAKVVPGVVLHHQIATALASHDYGGIAAFSGKTLTHFHTPPLTVLICLASIVAMRMIDPATVFVLILLALLGYWCHLATLAGRDRREAVTWGLLGIFSYPMLLMIDRGNIYAGLTALLVLHAMLLARQDRAPIVAGLLLAIAVNIRPNAVIFVVPLLLLMRSGRGPAFASLAISGMVIGLTALMATHVLYPDYTLATFRAGLARYYQVYVVDDVGMRFGSSLFGMGKFLLSYRPGMDLAAMLVALAMLIGAVVQYWRERLSPACLLFLVAAAYTLGSAIICDYHLLVFLIVPIFVARSATIGHAERIALIAACLILAPKNYIFSNAISWQVVVNPLILLGAAVAILALSLRRVSASSPDGGYSRAAHAA